VTGALNPELYFPQIEDRDNRTSTHNQLFPKHFYYKSEDANYIASALYRSALTKGKNSTRLYKNEK
jgi:hypothetical protein